MKKLLVSALVNIAKEYSEEYNYDIIDHRHGEHFRAVEMGEYGIVVRDRFDNTRLDIYSPEREWFCSVEYCQSNAKYSESQIFREKGLEAMLELKKRVDKELERIKNEN